MRFLFYGLKTSYFKQRASSIILILLSLRKQDLLKSESSIFSKIERNDTTKCMSERVSLATPFTFSTKTYERRGLFTFCKQNG